MKTISLSVLITFIFSVNLLAQTPKPTATATPRPTIISKERRDFLAKEIADLEKGKDDGKDGEKYKAIDEFDYKKQACNEFVKTRSAVNYNFLRNSKPFDEKSMAENLSAFNVLLQMAQSSNFPKETCLDYAIEGDADKQKLKLSFAFKRNYLEADATAHLDETAKLGYILSRFGVYKTKVISDKNVITPVSNIYIHGFADQETFSPKKEMTYLDASGVSKTYKYDGEKLGLWDFIVASKTIAGYPVIPEMTSLENLLSKKHMKFPFGETKDPKMIESYNNYISEIEANEYLALNRAIQTKRALSKWIKDTPTPFEYLQIGRNASSSCKNKIVLDPLYKSNPDPLPGLVNRGANCAKRRTTVVEVNANSYLFRGDLLAGGGEVLGLGQSPGAFFYSTCAHHGTAGSGRTQYTTESLLYLLLGKDGPAQGYEPYVLHPELKKGGYWESTADKIYTRVLSGSYTIVDVIKEANPTVTLDKIKKDLDAFVAIEPKSKVQKLWPYSTLSYTLDINQISKILSLPLFRFFTYPYSNDPKLQAKASGPWTMKLNQLATGGRLATDLGSSFYYFNQTRMYLDKNCKFTNSYLPKEKLNQIIPQSEIYELIKNGPIASTAAVYKGTDGKGIAKEDCLVFPQTLEMVSHCKLMDAGPTGSSFVEPKALANKLPYFDFSGLKQAEKEFVTTPDATTGVLQTLGVSDKAAALRMVNDLLCVNKKDSGEGYFKPTIDEQEDCK